MPTHTGARTVVAVAAGPILPTGTAAVGDDGLVYDGDQPDANDPGGDDVDPNTGPFDAVTTTTTRSVVQTGK